MGGGLMFEASAIVVLPAALSIDDLRTHLEAVASHLMVDLALSE